MIATIYEAIYLLILDALFFSVLAVGLAVLAHTRRGVRIAGGEVTCADVSMLSLGADAILFTCSAFGPAIERVASRLAVPVLKPNEAMFAEALTSGRRIGMLATFAPSIPSMEDEFRADAARAGAAVELRSRLVPGALDALNAGRPDEHARHIVEAAGALGECDAIMLAQFSMAPVAGALRQAVACPVLTSPASAVATLKDRLEGRPRPTGSE